MFCSPGEEKSWDRSSLSWVIFSPSKGSQGNENRQVTWYHGLSFSRRLILLLKASISLVDIDTDLVFCFVVSWHIVMRMRPPREGSCDPIAPLELPHSLHAFQRVSETDELNKVDVPVLKRILMPHVACTYYLETFPWSVHILSSVTRKTLLSGIYWLSFG